MEPTEKELTSCPAEVEETAPVVSIIVSVYNTADFLPKCLDGLVV